MSALFMFCAVIGGTILVCQLVLTLVGFGDHSHVDHGGDIGHGGHIGHGGNSGHGDLDHSAASPDGHDANGHHGSTWLFGVVSFRTMVAATTFFGLGGLLAESLQARPPMQLATGLLMGGAAMATVYQLMKWMNRLTEDGTVRIRRAVGLNGTVYVPIPGNKSGAGKVHVNLQNRLMEYSAVTANQEKLATGAQIVVVDIIGTDTLEVAPADLPVEQHAA